MANVSDSVKERLTGAIILVALMVLLVPELLTGPVRPAPVPASTATSPEEPPLRSYTIDLADDSRAHGTAATPPQSSGAPADSTAANPPSISEQAADGGAEVTQATAPDAALGKTSDETKPPVTDQTAQAAASEFAEKPHPQEKRGASSAAASVTSGAATSSTGGPRAGTAATTSAVMPSAAMHADSTTGWVVQLGVFASRPNAERLAEQLKGKGFKVSVSESPGGGRKLFRVRAGPVGDRTAAQELAAKLRGAGAVATVVPRT